jgi:hypothetical protein
MPLHHSAALSGLIVLLVSSSVYESSACNERESFLVLQEFFIATNGASWTSTWNMNTTSPCALQGISCSNNTCVTGIDLSQNHLSGTLPEALRNFTSLITFNVAGNHIGGTLPPEYSAWTSMVQFKVSNNSISGTLPREYQSWTQVWEFHISLNNISGTLPPEYADMHEMGFFSAFNNRLTGTLPPQFSNWRSVIGLSVQNNSLTGSLPPQYGTWTLVNVISLSNNSLTGSLPASWGAMNLTTFIASHNHLTGSIPPELLRYPHLDVFSVGYNSLEGTLTVDTGKISTARLFDVQNNLNLSGCLSCVVSPSCAGAICETRVTSPTLLMLCLPPSVTIPFNYDAAIATLASYTVAPSLPNSNPTTTPITTVPPPLPSTPSPAVAPVYSPPLSPPSAFVAIISIVEPVGGVGLVALGTSRCAPAAMKSSTSAGRVLLSPFYALGNGASVLGNVGVALLVAALHYTSVRVLLWREHRSNHGQQVPSSANNVMSIARFPQMSIVCAVHLSRGIAFFSALSTSSVTEGDEGNDDEAVPLRGVAAAVGALALVTLVVALVKSEMNGVARKQLHFHRFRQASLCRIRWLHPILLPVGIWGPADARRRIGVLRGPIVAGSERFAMLWSAVSVLSSLVVGAVPGSAGGCMGLAVAQVVLLGGASIVVTIYKPMRVPVGGWLVCATWVVEICLSVVIAVGRSTSSEATADAAAVFSVLHTIIGALRCAHRAVLWWWERGLPAADVVDANTEASPSRLRKEAPIRANATRRKVLPRHPAITLGHLMDSDTAREDAALDQRTISLVADEPMQCDTDVVAAKLQLLISMCCECRAGAARVD